MESLTTLKATLAILLNDAVAQKIFPGCVVGVVTKKNRIIIPVGRYTYDKTSQKIKKNSIYDIASITKTVPTSLLALKLIEERKLSLNQKVRTYLPEFKGKWKDEVTIFHLLTHTVDFGLTLSRLKKKKAEEIIHTILEGDLVRRPGTTYAYTNSTSIILGFLIEKATGKKLDYLARIKLFNPLEMRDTSFHPSPLSKERIVPTEFDSWRNRIIQGEVHDESAWVISIHQVVGSAGIFSTVPDLLHVLKMILANGVFRRKRILASSTITQMSTNQLQNLHQFSGLGWEMNKSFMGEKHSHISIGKTGFTGCTIFVDVEKKVGIVILSNHHFPKRSEKKDKYVLRAKIIDTVLATIV